MPLKPPPPTLRLSVDAEAIAHNWQALDRMSGTARAGAAVKADAYGLGIDHCVPVLRDAGCEAFFVAHWSEVEAVAQHVPPAQISVLHGPGNAEEAQYAKASGAIPVINSLEQARHWIEAGGGRCHLMIDTGINRLGVALDDLSHADIQSLEVDVLMSHLACADEDSAMNDEQLARFRSSFDQVPHRAKSFANSAGIALGPDYAFDLTRPGLALYGGVPRAELADAIKPVAHLEAAILQVRDLKPGDAVGYNAEFVAERAMRIGVVSLGYADGFLRARGQGGALLSEGAELPLLGKVSMDMIVVDLTNVPERRAGDWLQVPCHLPDIARQSSVSQYELLTTLGQRLRV